MSLSRRNFIKNAGLTTLAGVIASNHAFASDALWINNTNTLKVGLIGCGGRGSAAAVEAINADPNVVLYAMADAFEDHMEQSYASLKEKLGAKMQVTKEHRFVGLDAYQKLIDLDVDVVLLAAPPAFRPAHLEAAVKAGKHIFCEKPFAVDGPGLRRVIAASKEAKSKNLALVSGFCWRYHVPKREAFGRVLNGQIGEVLNASCSYNTGELWYKERQPGWTDFEYQLRNWLYYNWLSGDHIIEQAIHSIDMMQWAMGDQLPLRVTGSGGRQKRVDKKFGNVYDHFSVVYEYPDGVKGYFSSRQQNNTAPSYDVELIGDTGRCIVDCRTGGHDIVGKNPWKYADETKFTDENAYKKTNARSMYQQEHDELFASIRSNKPKNDGEWMVKSNLVALAGRMAAYSGQTVSLEAALASNQVLFPGAVSWDTKYDLPIAIPGIDVTI
ncbi:Gfo/Idh/MocA family protein [Sphingobacterium psychroaquaticum]|uniref:Tat (Twin-arginine translocation) pathway signal sequence n=1 Tax=Sphingobacterium psychroaquaticum TaxID=561061 RepID=A0A1X7KRQ6_9SPHI|nr:Gfo/Idh/MocA family oxidoreductase [Sphingobacterium psychroaquaticum]SMG44125.1 Tat (twin-arginine translocation) pathway signal sequence [Sphingobacterium psychroaquaticum]